MPDDQPASTVQPSGSESSATPGPSAQKVVIQPSAGFAETVKAERELAQQQPVQTTNPNPASANVYPTAQNVTMNGQTMTPAGAAALSIVDERTKDANRRVCMRVKTILVIGILIAISGVFTCAASIRAGQYWIIVLVAGFIELAFAAGLLLPRDHNTVATVLKVIIVLQILSVLGSLARPTALPLPLIGLGIMYFAYTRVKSLRYY